MSPLAFAPLAATRRAWNTFWFAEASPLGLAAFRILFAACLLREVGTSRVRSLGALEGGFHLAYVDWIRPVPEALYDLLHTMQYPFIVMLGVGFAMRLSSGALLCLQGWIFFADRLDFRNHAYFFLLLLILLLPSPAGDALSLRSWWRSRRGRPLPVRRPLTFQRLIQVQVSIVYAFAGLHKLTPAYLRGDVLRSWLERDLFARTSGRLLPIVVDRPTVEAWLLQPPVIATLAWATVALELLLPLALWHRRTRAVAILLGTLFHLAIAFVMEIRVFSLCMIASYLLFLEPDTLAAGWARLRGRDAANKETRPMKRAALACLPLTVLIAVNAQARTADEWLTVAEASGFEATATYAETLAFLERLDEQLDEVRVTSFGRSAAGRELPLVVVSRDGAFTPEAAAASGKPVVLVQNGIHAGEIDGKEASLMLLRDLALGRAGRWPDGLILLVVPIYNVDGHERVSPFNRPNQDGPRLGMGFRTTADGHDLNRDHLKLETPEARALMAVANAWRPHLHVDNHVTDGSQHAWVLTWSRAEFPQLAPSVDAWMADNMPAVVARTERAGHRVGPYVWLVDRDNPSKGVDSRVGEPRYATGYWPLRNRASILVENHSYKPFRERVLANRDFLHALLERVGVEGRSLLEAVHQAEERTIAQGRPGAPPSNLTLEYGATDGGDTLRFPVYDWYHEPSEVLGEPLLRYRPGRIREIEVPWIHRPTPEITVPRPRGYLILPGWPAIEQRLVDHGLRVLRLDRAVVVEVETLRLERLTPEQPGSTYQGLTRMVPQVRRSSESRELPRGTLWVPADQTDFEIAAQLLEPEAPDSLVRWGLLSSVSERKEYIDPRVLETLAVRMLGEDPDLAEAWSKALEDETLASDPQARWEWWYRRTPHWDETVGLMPVMRLLEAPNFSALPWSAGTLVGGSELATGPWRAWLESPGGELPFGLEIEREAGGLRATLINGEERIPVPRTRVSGRRLLLAIDPYDSSISAEWSADGRRLDGVWRKTAGPDREARLDFHAVAGLHPRFPAARARDASWLTGRWAVGFESDEQPAVGVFEGEADGTVRGTFLTTTGDYRYLAGRLDGDRLRLSAFDGAHAFLFDARLAGNGSLAGEFWSRDSWHETWTARPDPNAALPDPLELTSWIDSRELSTVAYPDLEGRPRSLADPSFRGRARIVEIFGSWCPNCNDAARLMVELDERYRDRGLSILGLAFEMTGDFESDAAQVRRWADYHGVRYPILVAGTSDKTEASQAFPLVDRVRSYPTFLFLDADGDVRAVYQGFSGPATGEAHTRLRARFTTLIEDLLAAP